MTRLVLFEPDIPQNTGTLMRLCACLGVPLDVVEPCGFILDDRRMRRALMDYWQHLEWTRHASWQAFLSARPGGRLVLLDVAADTDYPDFAFRPDDMLVAGSEGAGVPDAVKAQVDAAVRIPMRSGPRSLNVAVASAMVLGEALRQTGLFPGRRDSGHGPGGHDPGGHDPGGLRG